MDLIEYKSGYRSRHPWELARFHLFLRLLKKNNVLKDGPIDVLDIGSGDAWFAAQLLKHLPFGSSVTCCDIGYRESDLLEQIRRLNPTEIAFCFERPAKKFDLLLLMDVLEHVEDDRNFLQSIVDQNMKAESTLLVSVPTWQTLFSSHDKLLAHFRRYAPTQIKKVLRGPSLEIRQRGSIFTTLLIFRALEVLKAKFFPASRTSQLEIWRAGRFVTRFVQHLLQLDGCFGFLVSKIGIDFLGLSWWAVCKR